MIRKVVLLAVVVMAASVALAAAADAAKVPPVTGRIGACISGATTFKKPLTASTPAPKATTMTATDSVSSFGCGSTNVSGGKATINDGSVKLHWSFAPGLDCVKLTAGTAVTRPTATVTFKNKSGPKPVTVATLHLKLVDVGTLPPYSFVFQGTLPQNKAHTRPFGGESYELDVGFANCGVAPSPSLVAELRID